MNRLAILIYVLVLLITNSCVRDESYGGDKPPVEQTDTVINLTILEPSGLAFNQSKDALYTVSDNSGKVYKISLKGEVLQELSFVGVDLEGIDVDKLNGEIWVVEEGLQKIDHLTTEGTLINSITSVHVNTISSSGFEGIAKNGDVLYILIEKSPGTLIAYHISTNTWTQYSLSFASDFSGIDYDITDNTLWIVSHESKTLNHCTLTGSLIASQLLDVEQAEGVAINRQDSIAWIVSDQGNKLHRIKIKN
jgi:uncharacterized protein YjiK